MRKFLAFSLTTLAALSLGLALTHCGNGNGHDCDTNEDCPQGQWCDRTTWTCECVKQCIGKCCGDDSCGGTCPDECPTGQTCDTDCTCKGVGECYNDPECVTLYGANYTCNLGTNTCECTPNCAGKCCGDDGCGSTCADTCTAPMTCNTTACACEGPPCTTANDCADPDTQCCINQACVDMACGALECGLDPVCQKECGPCVAPEVCNAGVCEGVDPCPSGQECVQVGANGSMGCVIPPNTIPGTNPTDCANIPCEGNFSCYCMDATCSTSQCVENCGTCAAGSECCQYTASGIVACMLPGCTDDLPNPPFCDANTPCQGNSGCFTDGTNNWCANLCSVDHGPCTNNDVKCDGDTVQTCTNGAWVDTTDCTTTSQVCVQGACVNPVGLGEFCDTTPCAAGLDCVSTETSVHAFCTPQCDCTNQTGCDADWACLFQSSDTPPICWCAKLCVTAADCPDAGAGGYTCDVLANDGTDDIYGCVVQ